MILSAILATIIIGPVSDLRMNRWLKAEDAAKPQIAPNVSFSDLETQVRESIKNTAEKMEALKKTIADQQAILKQGARLGGDKVVQVRREVVKRLSGIVAELARLNQLLAALEQQLVKIRKTCDLTGDDELSIKRQLSVIQGQAENARDQLRGFVSYLQTTKIVLFVVYETTVWDQLKKEDGLALLEALANAEESIKKLKDVKKARIIPPVKPAPPKKSSVPDDLMTKPPTPMPELPMLKPPAPPGPIFGTPKSLEEARKKLRDDLERWAKLDDRLAKLLEREINKAIEERIKQLQTSGLGVGNYQKIFERIKRLESAMALVAYLEERSSDWQEMARRTLNVAEIDSIIEAVKIGRDKYDGLLKQMSANPPESAYLRSRILFISIQQSRIIAVLEQIKRDWQNLLSPTPAPR